MADIPVGFKFPIKPAGGGVSGPNFNIVRTAEGHIVPGIGTSGGTVKRSYMGGFPGGECRLEVLPEGVDPFDRKTSDILLRADKVSAAWAAHPQEPEPFLIFNSPFADDLAAGLEAFKGQFVSLVFTLEQDIRRKKPDPDNKGWTLGWGVYRKNPWEFVGLFETEEKAEEEASKLGEEYSYGWGSNRDGSDDFLHF